MNEIVRLIPSPQSRIISKDEVSLVRLQNVFETALFDVKMHLDGDLYVTDGLDFPCWIRLLDDDETLITFFMFVDLDDPDKEDWPDRMNEINHRISPVQFHLVRKCNLGSLRDELRGWSKRSAVHKDVAAVQWYLRPRGIVGL